MKQLVPNEVGRFFSQRLSNEHLISGKIFMSASAYRIVTQDHLNQSAIQVAINENQFSTGAMSRLTEIFGQVASSKGVQEVQDLVRLKGLIARWLITLDLARVVIQ